MVHLLSRRQLFDMVWSKPIRDIAPQYGVSDVALAKICRQHDLPLPGRGYWAKLKAGKPMQAPPLPPRGLGMHEAIRIGKEVWLGREAEDARLMSEDIPPAPEFSESLADLTERVTRLVGKVVYMRDLSRTHGAIARLLDDDAKRIEKRSEAEYTSYFDKPYFVSPYERRRLKLLNSIFLSLARLDVSASVHGKNPSRFSIRVGNTDIGFRLDAPTKKHQHDEWRSASDERRPSSDPLQLSISWHMETDEAMRLVWEDHRDTPIEDCLQDIVVGLVVAGEMQYRVGENYRHARAVERRAELIEAARKREEDARKAEQDRVCRLDRARMEKLFEDSMSLRLANDLRAYIDAVQKANGGSSNPVSENEMAQWVAWASAQAERIDPVLNKSFLQQAEDPDPAPKADQVQVPSHSKAAETASEPAWHPNRWYTRLHR
jgi:hypothetical protein